MAIVLFDNSLRKNFYPLSLNNALAHLRCGIFTPAERWQLLTNGEVLVQPENYLQSKYNAVSNGLHTWIDALLILNDELIELITSLKEDEAIYDSTGIIAACTNDALSYYDKASVTAKFKHSKELQQVKRIESAWHMLHHNNEIMRFDFDLIISRKANQSLSSTNNLLLPENIFTNENVSAEYCIINALAGPVYIGRHVHIMEGSIIKGPVALCDHSTVKAGTRIYGATTIGPHSVAGGEVKNSIFHSYSNKAHDGYAGDSVVGNWCNMGAGTSNSNLKNNSGIVNVWNYMDKALKPFAQKAGMVMGDYSRTAINTSINTGTTIGISCNIFGENNLTPNLIQNFSWGMKGKNSYTFEKAIIDAANWKKLKAQELTAGEVQVLKHIFENL